MKIAINAAILGVALSIASAASAAPNLVANGSFETGNFSGFTQFGTDTSYDGVKGALDLYPTYTPTNGAFQAYFGSPSSASGINQTVTTVAGQMYNFSFDLSDTPPDFIEEGIFQSYAVSFNNVVLGFGNPTNAFQNSHFSFAVTGTGSDTFSFAFQNQPAFFTLDNVSLAAVPEPATWGMMLIGFGAMGLAMRRRTNVRTSVRFA